MHTPGEDLPVAQSAPASDGSQFPPRTDGGLLASPLAAAHAELGATMGPFGGWDMPISYAGGGVVAEHQAVRHQVGLFDVSHLGKVSVVGAGAAAFVNSCLTADLDRIAPGQAQYTLCCNSGGGVVDDLIAYLVEPDEVFLVPNAANTAAVAELLAAAAPAGVEVRNRHFDFGVIAVQGPEADQVLEASGLPVGLDYMSFVDTEFAGRPVRICRTGYTGERGYELIPDWEGAPALWATLYASALAFGGRASGLGARDTLRTEMGYPLHGQDLGPDISPVQARLGWAVGWGKADFFGRDALLAEKQGGPRRTLWGLRALGRGVIRPHLQVRDLSGTTVGETTTGTFSPTLGEGIGLALLDSSADASAGLQLVVDVRGRDLPVEVVRPPFVPSHVR